MKRTGIGTKRGSSDTAYRRRMRIDEGFRDWKQRLGLRQAAVSTVERMARLVAGLVLATLILALLGLVGLPAGFQRAVLGRGKGSKQLRVPAA